MVSKSHARRKKVRVGLPRFTMSRKLQSGNNLGPTGGPGGRGECDSIPLPSPTECKTNVPIVHYADGGAAVDLRTIRSALTLMMVGSPSSSTSPEMRSMISLAAKRPIS